MHVQYMRFVIAAITTLCAFAVYVSRVNLSIAIIAMVDESVYDDNHKISHKQAGGVDSDLTQTTSAPTTPDAVSVRYQGNEFEPNRTMKALALSLNQTRVPMRSIFPAIKDKVVPLITQTKFTWSQVDQGHILGAFFYGYILFQIPGARIAETVGARWIIMAASIGSTVVSLTFPMATQLNSIYLLMMLRFVMGLCQSAFFPAAYVLCCRWLPEKERSILLPLIFIGSNMGSISTYIASSYLITSPLGWPSVFYTSGMVCLVVSVLWCIFGSSEPSQSLFISDKERIYIETLIDDENSANSYKNQQHGDIALDSFQPQQQQQQQQLDNKIRYYPRQDINNNLATDNDVRELRLISTNLTKQSNEQCCVNGKPVNDNNNDSNNKKKDFDNNSMKPERVRRVVPEASWIKLIRSVPVWTLVLSMYGNEWSNVVLCYELPTYLNTALGFPIEQNGVINSFFQLAFAISSPVMSALGAYLLERHMWGMQKIHVRKTFQSLATFGQLFCFVSVPICGDNRGMIILFMFSAIIFRSCANAGDIMVPGDLSPDYAGTIFAFANSVGNTAGFFAPSLVGVFVHSARDREQWTPFWLTTGAIMGCSGLIFLIFGEVRRQDFDKTPKTRPISRCSMTINIANNNSVNSNSVNGADVTDSKSDNDDNQQKNRNKLITKVIFK